MTENHIFGPVNSRRLGRSLGIDLLPFKTCSYDCVYCECGATTSLTTERAEFFPTEEVITQLDKILRKGPILDYITFAGSGEPTLSLSIGRIIRHLKTTYPQYKVAVLTNGSLLGNKEVRDDLARADLVIPTLTSTSQETFERIHRPYPGLLTKTIINYILEFRKEFRGEMWLEIFLIPDQNTSLEELASLRDVIDKIQPARIQLNTLDRPAAEDWVTAPDEEELIKIRNYFVELNIPVDVAGVCCEQPDICIAGESTHAQILKTLHIRPCTVEDLASMTGLHHHEVAKYLSGLLDNGTVHVDRGKRGVFYFAGPERVRGNSYPKSKIIYSSWTDNKIMTVNQGGTLTLDDLRGRELGIPTKLPAFNPDTDVPAAPDYTNPDSWLSMPAYFSTEKQQVDVFWVYPTILSDNVTYLMDISDAKLREKAHWTLVEQASIFDGQANIYAPFYRQNNVKINPMMLTDAKPIFDLGQQDLTHAFAYFLKHFNKGERPIILAAHSQGSVRVVELSKAGELLTRDAESLKRLVAAYVIGYSITQSDLEQNPLMKISESATETGCFITYNTISYEEGKEKEGPTIIPGTFVVNPLNWKTDTTFAPASENIEAVFFKHEHPESPDRYPNFAAAQVVNNALVITNISNPEELPATSVTFPEGVYHMYDYAIFYGNLRKNVGDRIRSYLEYENVTKK